MEISIDPNPENLQTALASIPQDHPVVMLNLLRFRTEAAYKRQPSGQNETLSGQQAYGLYAEQAFKFITEVGAKLIWRGQAKASLIAPADEQWDEVFLVKYPDIGSFIKMITNPDYQAITFHRTAALANSRLIATFEQD